jgi:hypothetical protein
MDSRSPLYVREERHQNVRATIHAYETGLIDGSKPVWFADGKIVPYEEAMKSRG